MFGEVARSLGVIPFVSLIVTHAGFPYSCQPPLAAAVSSLPSPLVIYFPLNSPGRQPRHEVHVVPPDAVHRTAGRLPREASVGVGRHPFLAVRPEARAPHVQRLHGRARIRCLLRLRRDLRQRAPFQRLRPDAVAQPDRLVAVPPHHEHDDLRDGQLAGAVQPANPCRGRVRDDRLHLRRPADRRLSGRHADGRLLRLRPEPLATARALLRGARPGDEGLAASRHVRVQRPLQPAALRQHLAAPGAATASAGVDTRRRLDRDLAVVRRDGLRLFVSCPISATRSASATMDGYWAEMDRLGKDRNPYRAGFAQTVAVAEIARAGDRALHRGGRVLLPPLPARRSALRRAARLHHRSHHALRPTPARSAPPPRARRRGRPR